MIHKSTFTHPLTLSMAAGLGVLTLLSAHNPADAYGVANGYLFLDPGEGVNLTKSSGTCKTGDTAVLLSNRGLGKTDDPIVHTLPPEEQKLVSHVPDRLCVYTGPLTAQHRPQGGQFGYTTLGVNILPSAQFRKGDAEGLKRSFENGAFPAYCTLTAYASLSPSDVHQANVKKLDLEKDVDTAGRKRQAAGQPHVADLILSPEEFAYLQSIYPPRVVTAQERMRFNMLALIAHASFELSATDTFIRNTGGRADGVTPNGIDGVARLIENLTNPNVKSKIYGLDVAQGTLVGGTYGQQLHQSAKNLVQFVKKYRPANYANGSTNLLITDQPNNELEKLLVKAKADPQASLKVTTQELNIVLADNPQMQAPDILFEIDLGNSGTFYFDQPGNPTKLEVYQDSLATLPAIKVGNGRPTGPAKDMITVKVKQHFRNERTDRGEVPLIQESVIKSADAYAIRKPGPNNQSYIAVAPQYYGPKEIKIDPLPSIDQTFLSGYAIEKSLTFQPKPGDDVLIVNDTDANVLTDMSTTQVQVYVDGQPLTWDSPHIGRENDPKVDQPTLFYTFSNQTGQQIEATYSVNGQRTTTMPTTGPVVLFTNHDGIVGVSSLAWQSPETDEQRRQREARNQALPPGTPPELPPAPAIGTVEFREVVAPAYTKPRLDRKVVDVDESAFNHEGADGPVKPEDKGLLNALTTFHFEGRKVYSVTTPDLADHAFSDAGQAELRQRMPVTQVTFELQHADGRAVTWDDKQMFFIKKNPAGFIEKGTWATNTGPVRLHPDQDGWVKAKGFLALDKTAYQLKEVAVPDRAKLDSEPLLINAAPDATDNVFREAKQPDSQFAYPGQVKRAAQDSMDITGIRLEKRGGYRGIEYGGDAPGGHAGTPHIGQASFTGATYTLFYGDGWGAKTGQPVLMTDWVLDVAKSQGQTLPAKYGVEPTGEVRWVGKQDGQLTVAIDLLPWGSWYVQETTAGIGHHIDPKRYYFGDRPSDQTVADPNHQYLPPMVDAGAQVADQSRAIRQEGDTTDQVKLVASTLEKRVRWLKTGSPFMRGQGKPYGQGNGVTFAFDQVTDQMVLGADPVGIPQNIGLTLRGGNTYGLFYAAPTIDGQGQTGEPVKWSDRVVERMKITTGEPVKNRYTTSSGNTVDGAQNVVIRTDGGTDPAKHGRIAVQDVAYGTYFWRELDTTPGLARDTKEYVWGADRSAPHGIGDRENVAGQPVRVGKPNAPYDVTAPISQTTQDPNVHTDVNVNWSWMNTFDGPRRAGSTNHVVTFGFSSQKLAESTNKLRGDGENGVEMVLTPIEGTRGAPIKTTTFRQAIRETNGSVRWQDGYFEFRTVPYGRYRLTSNSATAGSDNRNYVDPLQDIGPMIVDFVRLSNGNYALRFYRDENENKQLDLTGALRTDSLISEFVAGKDQAMPTQKVLDDPIVADTVNDLVEEGGELYFGEPRVWTRNGHADTSADGATNNNFISAEANIGWAGFDVVDRPVAQGSVRLATTVRRADGTPGTRTVPANTTVHLVDSVTITQTDPYVLSADGTFTLRTFMVDAKTRQPVTPASCTPVTVGTDPKQFTQEVPITLSTMGLHDRPVTVFQYLHQGLIPQPACDTFDKAAHKVIAAHADVNDPNQTVTPVHDGVIKTTATNPEPGTGDPKQVAGDQTVVIRDRIALDKARLIPGKIYTVARTQPVMPCGEPHTTWPQHDLGTLPVPLREAKKVKDANGQCAIAIPYSRAVVVRDTKVGQTGAGQAVLEASQFVYQAGMDHVDVDVTVDTTGLAPRTPITLFEEVTGEGIRPMVHADIHDGDQTVFTQGHVMTNLFNVTKPETPVKRYTPGEHTVVVDHVQGRGIVTGKPYTITLTLMEPAQNRELDTQDGTVDGMTPYKDKAGRTVSAVKTFTPATPNVEVQVSAAFEAAPRHVPIVAYETITSVGDGQEQIVLAHRDPKDPKQTIIPAPGNKPVPTMLKTMLATIDRAGSTADKKTFVPGETLSVRDSVRLEGDPIPGGQYELSFALMRPTDDQSVDVKDGIDDGMTPFVDATGTPVQVTKTVTMQPGQAAYDVVATFATKPEDKTKLVAYETIKEVATGKVIAHTDANDADQTISPVDPPATGKTTPEDKPGSPPVRSLAKTGVDGYGIAMWLSGLVALVSGGFAIWTRKTQNGCSNNDVS